MFRATRAHANTNETIAAFLLFACAGVFVGANPGWLCGSAWLYVSARVAHMLFYYADQRLARSGSFVIGFAALVSMGVSVLAR